jgi:hypothetical protein
VQLEDEIQEHRRHRQPPRLDARVVREHGPRGVSAVHLHNPHAAQIAVAAERAEHDDLALSLQPVEIGQVLLVQIVAARRHRRRAVRPLLEEEELVGLERRLRRGRGGHREEHGKDGDEQSDRAHQWPPAGGGVRQFTRSPFRGIHAQCSQDRDGGGCEGDEQDTARQPRPARRDQLARRRRYLRLASIGPQHRDGIGERSAPGGEVGRHGRTRQQDGDSPDERYRGERVDLEQQTPQQPRACHRTPISRHTLALSCP